MSTSPNWENLFKPVYCSVCGQDVSVDKCDCVDDLSEIVEDDYGDDKYEE
jgi:predicted nucleic acid-binding Zn ribbon protein